MAMLNNQRVYIICLCLFSTRPQIAITNNCLDRTLFYCWWNYQLIDHLRRLNILIIYKLVPPNYALFDVLHIQLIGDTYDKPNNDMFECHML